MANIPPTWNNLVVHFTLTESDIPYSWQGMSEVDYCDRLMLPDQNGTPVDLINNTQINIPLSFTLDASWVAEKCQVAAFIQNLDTKEILQGNKVWLSDLIEYSSVTVQYPNGGEVWVVGETEDITWTCENVSDVKIEISFDNGNTWSTIADSIPNTETYSWTVTAQDSSNECLIKISNVANGEVFDMSDNVFSIDIVSDVDEKNQNPLEFNLAQNYPNPFNPSTTIKYAVATTSFVSIKVYDMIGQEVASLVNEMKDAGTYEVKFDGKNLASGVYIYKMSADNFTSVKKLNLLK